MTECGSAEIRDLLPDFVSETLSRADAARVRAHLDECGACIEEIALLRVARAVRPVAVPIDVARIVAALPRPAGAARALALAPSMARPARRTSWQLWKAAAAVGVLLVGGWSVMVARSGGLASMSEMRSDSARMVEVAERALVPTQTNAPGDGRRAGASDAVTASAQAVHPTQTVAPSTMAVSVGDLSEYTDVELERMLARLEKWDGATSAEPASQVPIVPVGRSGSER